MKKKWFYRALAAVLSVATYCAAFSFSAFAADKQGANVTATQSAETAKSDALFLSSVNIAKAEANYAITYEFDKSVATEKKDITATAASFFVVNGKALSEVTGATVGYKQSGEKMVVSASVPVSAGLIKDTARIGFTFSAASFAIRVTSRRCVIFIVSRHRSATANVFTEATISMIIRKSA